MTRRARRRGYTVVELMMALAVFATGVTGVIAMERTVIAANRHSRSLTVANGIAQAWLDQLSVDSSVWQTNLARTVWLQTIDDPGVNGNWQLPAQSVATVRNFGPTFNVFGKPDAAATDYCVHIRLTWLSQDQAGGTASIRTEVRVFWPRDGATRVAGDCTSVSTTTVNAVGTDANDSYFFVYQAGAVAQRP
jgi:type IV pilus assembly protein PilV